MPEGDTIYKIASALRPHLEGREIVRARGAARGPRLDGLTGSTLTDIQPMGKHLIMRFSNGLALHTHLRMTGSWHRYAPGMPWRKPAHQAVVVLETRESVVVCFQAPVVELLDEGTVSRRRAIATLGPDILAPSFDRAEALHRLRAPVRAALTLGEALLDQRAVAGVGNEYKSEILFIERLDPWLTVGAVDDNVLKRVLATAERLLRFNVEPGRAGRVTTGRSAATHGSRVWVYGRAGRPCFRCGERVQRRIAGEQARVTFWCPRCQAGGRVGTGPPVTPRDSPYPRADSSDA